MTNKAKKKSQKNGKEFLQSTFAEVQKVLLANLNFSSATVTHNGVMGEENEKHWIEIFKKYLPSRYAVDNGIVIDHFGKTSDHIDIVIYDRQYTPVLLNQKNHRYIPAESVYAIFEVKPHIDFKYLVYAGKKAESVRKLKRTSVSIVQLGEKCPPRDFFEIISGIVATKVSWKDGLGKTFKKNIDTLVDKQKLNCGVALEHGSFDFFQGRSNLTINTSSGALIFFLFRLLNQLQELGTVPAIDWNAYLSSFNDL